MWRVTQPPRAFVIRWVMGRARVQHERRRGWRVSIALESRGHLHVSGAKGSGYVGLQGDEPETGLLQTGTHAPNQASQPLSPTLSCLGPAWACML